VRLCVVYACAVGVPAGPHVAAAGQGAKALYGEALVADLGDRVVLLEDEVGRQDDVASLSLQPSYTRARAAQSSARRRVCACVTLSS
jgi:hypothetical protein